MIMKKEISLKKCFFIKNKYRRSNPEHPTIKYKNDGNDIINVYTDDNGDELRKEEILGIWIK